MNQLIWTYFGLLLTLAFGLAKENCLVINFFFLNCYLPELDQTVFTQKNEKENNFTYVCKKKCDEISFTYI